MDEKYLEYAEEHATAQVQCGIENARKRAGPPPGFDGTCSCGDSINPARVNLGYYRCLYCQTQQERLGRQYR
jgi:hypothetical protein